MMPSYSEAIDEIYSLFFDAWSIGASSIIGYVPDTRFEDVELATAPDASKHWCRISTKNVLDGQTSFDGGDGKRFTSEGLVFVQLFAPKSLATSSVDQRLLAEVAQKAFRGKTTRGKIWFRNVGMRKLSAEELYYRVNVQATFQYDEKA